MPEPAMIDPLAAPTVSVPDAPLPTSALAGRLAARKVLPAGREAAGVQLSERPIGALWQVTAWTPRLSATGAAVAAACGAPAPGPGMAAGVGSVTALRIEPLRWLVLVERGAEAGGAVVPALDPGDGTVLDLAHARTRLVVGGTERVALMARLGSVDWRPPAFGPGSVTTTQIGRVAVTVLGREESFELLLPRSYAASLFDIVAETAEGFGLEITG